MVMIISNREEWLNAATTHLKIYVFMPAGFDVPDDVKVSCGWPVSGGRPSSRKTTIGQCFSRELSKASINEIFISPSQNDSVKVLDILAHELIHAIDDCQNGHKGPFKRIAVAIGLEGKMTSTVAGDELKAKLEKIVEDIGDYPHKEIDLTTRKKQSTRNIKVECSVCGFNWRASKAMISRMTNNTCNGCGSDTLTLSN